MRSPRALGLLAVASLLCGCPKPPPASQFPTAADALGRMKAVYGCANGIQGEAKIDHFGERVRVRGDSYVFAVNPARVRIDVVSPLGATVFTLTSDGRVFQLNDVPNKQFLYGPASACNLARLTQVPIPGHALVYLLRGEAPLLQHESGAATIRWEDGAYRVDIPSLHDARQTVLLSVPKADYDLPWQQQRVHVVGVKTEQQGTVLYDVELRHHEPTETAPARVDEDGIDPPIPPSGPPCTADVPRSIHVEVPYTRDDVIFQYGKVTLNPPLPEGTFTQPIPAGSRAMYVDCEQ